MVESLSYSKKQGPSPNKGTGEKKNLAKMIRKRQEEVEHDEEQRLTSLLFGGQAGSSIIMERTALEQSIDSVSRTAETKNGVLFAIDRVGVQSLESSASVDVEHHDLDQERLMKTGVSPLTSTYSMHGGSKRAWIDEDDDNVEVNLLETSRLRKLRRSRTEAMASALNGVELQSRLRERYQSTTQLSAKVDWAQVKENNGAEKDTTSEFGQISTAEPLLQDSISRQRLPAVVLNVVRCPDANQSDKSSASIQALSFHPGSDPNNPLLLTAGFDKTLRFFLVGQEKSDKVHGIHFPKLPIYSASFLGTTGNVVVSGRRPFFYIYDSVAGKLDLIQRIIGREEKSLEKFTPSPDGRTIGFYGNDGYVILYDAQSKQWIANLKMNGSVRAVSFSNTDGHYVTGSGSDGDIYKWDLRNHRQCVDRFSNGDGTICSAMAVSTRHLAVGAESGVVNLYGNNGVRGTDLVRKPIKSIMNLHTSADMIRFNEDGQILAISSRREKKAMKLLHVPTATVFANWPTSKSPLNYVWSMDFSPQSRFLAIGSDQGKCLLYRLTHYQDNGDL